MSSTYEGHDRSTNHNVDKLVEAINENDEEKVKHLCNDKSTCINAFTKDYCFHAKVTPLFLASKLGRTSIVEVLLENGADVNAVDELGRTALQSACEENYEDVIDVLLAHNADPNAGSAEELQTPNNTCLGGAIKSQNLEVVEKLLNGGAKMNLNDESSQTLDWPNQRVSFCGNYLHLALNQSSAQIVQVLCKHGCDVNLRDDNGETPLFLAVRQVDITSSRVLLNHGADPNAVTEQGNTLNIAAATVPASKDMIELLVEYGAQLNVQERMKRVPLALYLSNFNLNRNKTIIKFLIQHGTILNDTSLVKEFKWMLNRLGQFDIVKMSIEGGMNVHNSNWLRKFMDSPPGRKYWYSSNDYDTEEEKVFRKYLEPMISTPHCLSKLCCFEIRNHLMFLGSGVSIAKDIEQLPLPEVVKQYLFLEHL